MKLLQELSDRDNTDRIRSSYVTTSAIGSFDIVSICAIVKDEEEEEGDPFTPTGS